MITVALVVKASDSTQMRDDRNMGYWSYPVPEFEWKHFVFGSRKAYAEPGMNKRDIIFQEDAGPRYFKNRLRPLVYLAIDGTLSDDHLQARLERAENADLILVDHDDLSRYECLGKPVKRLNYCINDKIMRNYGQDKIIDVSFCCSTSNNLTRKRVRNMLGTYCKKRRLVYQSGVMHITDYAKVMNRSKIVVNWPRTLGNRPHRVFDALACKTCLVSGQIPDVPGDNLVSGRDYVSVSEIKEIPDVIDELMTTGKWQEIAENGYKTVMKYHTWATRARQLREILKEELNVG